MFTKRWAILIVAAMGCGSPPPAEPAHPTILEDVAKARRLAADSGKPLVVFSVLGHCYRQC